MCVIVYKPVGKKLPNVDILEKCFKKNPDGAGYMLPVNNKVVIHKGFMTFNDFKKDIEKTLKRNHVKDVTTIPMVLHFRISTQGGRQTGLCHPYPVCRDYAKMRQLECESNIALCHNGIISSCSTNEFYGGCWDKQANTWVQGKRQRLDYNDTMTFIKDYASLVIDNDIHFDKKKSKIELLERLCEYSKLAIMTCNGNVTLIGDFKEKNGIYYSNLYHFDQPKKTITSYGLTRADFDTQAEYMQYLMDDEY